MHGKIALVPLPREKAPSGATMFDTSATFGRRLLCYKLQHSKQSPDSQALQSPGRVRANSDNSHVLR